MTALPITVMMEAKTTMMTAIPTTSQPKNKPMPEPTKVTVTAEKTATGSKNTMAVAKTTSMAAAKTHTKNNN